MLLNLHSYFSLRYGVLSVERLADGLQARGYSSAVLTDINNSTGSLQFVKACKERGLNGLAGIEFRNGDDLLYIGIAKNREGFKEMNDLLTHHNRYKTALPEMAPEFQNVDVIYPFERATSLKLRENEFIGIRHIHLNKIRLANAKQHKKMVVWQPVTFTTKEQYLLHRQLRAIDHNLLISQLADNMFADPLEVFPSKDALLAKFRDFPFLIANTERLLESCTFDFDFTKRRNKQTFTGNQYDDLELLRKYSMEGLSKRYGGNNNTARLRVIKELEIIDKLGFSAYFLIADDICRRARSKNYHYVGRGSGANSVIAYCLGITDVDPIELNLYFERFLNPKRQSPPDFDIDFSWAERDDMYDYIFHRYQSGHTALMGAMSTFRSRSIIREMGKVYGLPKAEIDRLVHDPSNMLNKNEITNMILSVYNQIEDFPNQRTIHASGVIISEKPITNYCALDYPPKGLPTMQFDMYIAEDIGYEKFDILSQRGIGHIKDCVEIIKMNKGKTIDVHRPQEFIRDPKINAQLRSSNTIGCFYIESPAMRQLISKLRCDNYLTLVAASSIIRPGVASSGMMKAYIERHHSPDKVEYLHPVFKEQLEDTYGVMVYQEDVMKVGHHFGGLDLADADVLRRMMSGKYRNKNHLLEIEEKYFAHCQAQGYPEEVSREVWRQMESFAGYSFNKAHSASFAIESYQSLFLKTYFPVEFMVAVLNNYGGFYTRKTYVNEAQKAGGKINLPCVNNSIIRTTVKGKEIYLGFDCLHNLESKVAEAIPLERLQNGPYTSLHNFVLRTGISLDQLIILIRLGAFRFTGLAKKPLLWEAHLLLSQSAKRAPSPLFNNSSAKQPTLPVFETSVVEDIYDEIELMGFPVSASMFDLVKTDFRGEVAAKNLCECAGKKVRMVGDFVCDKHVPTKNGKYMKFGTWLDANGDFFDTTHFPQSLAQFPLNGAGVYLILGKVVLDFGYPSIEVQKLMKLPLKPDPRSV